MLGVSNTIIDSRIGNLGNTLGISLSNVNTQLGLIGTTLINHSNSLESLGVTANANALAIYDLGVTSNNNTDDISLIIVGLNDLFVSGITVPISGTTSNLGSTGIPDESGLTLQEALSYTDEAITVLAASYEAFQVAVWSFNSAQALWNSQVLGYEVLNDVAVATIETDLTAVNASIVSINSNLTTLNIFSTAQTVTNLATIASIASHSTDISNLGLQ